MRSHPLFLPTLLALIALLATTLVFPYWFLPASRGRIEREHGLRLPPSASSFECRGDAARGYLDRGASSAFVITSTELPDFVSQLKIQPNLKTFIPGNSEYQLQAAWRAGTPMATYGCSSPVGDWLHVEVWPLDESRVGVCLYTDWN